MKKVIAFDLDGTLAPSKSPLPGKMSGLIKRLLQLYEVCVISGGKFGQFEMQLLGNLEASPTELQRLHIMPTCGTRYYLFDIASGKWEMQYAEDFTPAEKEKIIKAFNKGLDDLGFREKKVYGEILEDRGSQITFSALGQDIVTALGPKGVDIKEAWDPNNSKKNKLRDYIAPMMPGFEVRVGGLTSIDVTKLDIDKAYGMRKLLEMLEFGLDELLFVGDRLSEGGNDYPVKAMGAETIAVEKWQDTALVIETITKVT
ncbi:MAG: HAD-IIB family hydrolase [Patescibacteria group bacterium]